MPGRSTKKNGLAGRAIFGTCQKKFKMALIMMLCADSNREQLLTSTRYRKCQEDVEINKENGSDVGGLHNFLDM